MNRAALLALCCLLSGCRSSAPTDRPRHTAQHPERPAEALKRRFADPALPRQDRLTAGRALLDHPGGPAYLAARYRTPDRPLVTALLDTLAAEDRAAAARLAAGLMEAAAGEEKLDFEARLLQQGEAAIPPLVQILENGRDWQTVVQALDALGKLRAAQALVPVAARLADPNAWVRMASAHALGALGDSRAVPHLIGALNDTSETVAAAALIGLGRSGDPQAFAPCAASLDHPNPRVRAAAVSALGRLGLKGAVPLLKGMLNDPDPGVRYKAGRALNDLNEP